MAEEKESSAVFTRVKNALADKNTRIAASVAVPLLLILLYFFVGSSSSGFNSTTSLINDLQSEDSKVRAKAAMQMGMHPSLDFDLATPALGIALSDLDLDVQFAVAETLRKFGPRGSAAIPQLVQAVEVSISEHQEYDAQRKELDAQAAYDFDFEHKDWLAKSANVQIALVKALSSMGDGAVIAVPGLIKVLEGGNKQSVISALVGLGQLGLKAKDARENILKLLGSKDQEIKRFAVWAIGELRSLKAVPTLSKLLDDPSAEIRKNALKALKNINTPESRKALDKRVATLINDLKSREIAKRQEAASKLREIGTEKAQKAIRDAQRLS